MNGRLIVSSNLALNNESRSFVGLFSPLIFSKVKFIVVKKIQKTTKVRLAIVVSTSSSICLLSLSPFCVDCFCITVTQAAQVPKILLRVYFFSEQKLLTVCEGSRDFDATASVIDVEKCQNTKLTKRNCCVPLVLAKCW